MNPEADTVRLFIALWPSPRVRAALADWRDAWSWPMPVAPVQAERLHVTLHYIGSVPRVRLPALVPALQVPVDPFELRFGHAALWPHGVAVLQPAAVPERLLQLHAALGDALQRLALPIEARPYRPHVTLARHVQGALVAGAAAPIRWRVRGYALVESRRGGAGGYEVLQRYA